MKFIAKVKSLCAQYPDNFCEQIENALLLAPVEKKPPLAKHVIFAPMPPKIEQHLVSSYNRNFPVSLLELYREMNGCDLFWTNVKIQAKKKWLSIPLCQLSIYAVPLNDSRSSVQPFNISLEDLNRPRNTPKNWLKFGSYCKPDGNFTKFDLYVNVDDDQAYAVKRKSDVLQIEEEWDNLDLCLCSIFDLLYQEA